MNFVQQALSYLLTADNWTGPVGLAARTLEHLEYTAVAVGASALIAVPVGLIIGHRPLSVPRPSGADAQDAQHVPRA